MVELRSSALAGCAVNFFLNIVSSDVWSKPYFVCVLSRVRLLVTPWTVARQAPLSMEFSRQEHWSGLSFPTPRDLPDPGIKPMSPALQVNSSLSETPGKYCLLLSRQSLELPPLFHLPVYSQDNLASGCFNFISRVNDDLLPAKCQGCF